MVDIWKKILLEHCFLYIWAVGTQGIGGVKKSMNIPAETWDVRIHCYIM